MRFVTRFQLGFISALSVAVVLLFAPPASVQKPAGDKFKYLVERSQDAAQILSLLAEQPKSGFPKDLIAKAQIVAIFPRVTKQGVLVRQFLQGYGVISARRDNGWSLPAYYQFTSSERKFSNKPPETLAVVLVFLSKDAASWFAREGPKLKGERAAMLGPVGDVNQEQSKQLAGAPVVAYTYYNGRLNGSDIDPGLFKDIILDQDNHANLPLYGTSGQEILAGRKIDQTTITEGVAAFQEALQKYWPPPDRIGL